MNSERLFLVDPYDEDHMKLVEDFEKENEIHTMTVENAKKIQQVPREEYEQHKKLANEVRESLFLESSSKIKDICYIEGERDIKTCNISFAQIKTKLKNRRLISLATDYSIHTLGMKEIFIKTASNDRNMIENLEAKGFESLGEENGNIIYLKETEDTLNNQRKLA